MIVCSCNVLSDGQVRCAIATAVSSARISHVYASLGCAAKCGRCAHTIKIILEDTFAPLAKESVNSGPREPISTLVLGETRGRREFAVLYEQDP